MKRRARPAAPWRRLLLLAALLLGIVTMHTLGHPAESHAMEDGTAAHSVAPAAPAARAAHREPHHSAAPSAARAEPALAPAPAPALALASKPPPSPVAEAPGPRTGMDPMAVCLAVLAAVTLLLLGAGPAGSRDAAPLGGADRGARRSGWGPDPPSGRALLARLAVLRL